MIVKANAKINLALNVVGKREDGYHDLDMVMVPIDLYDTIEISLLSEEFETDLFLDDYSIPTDQRNTVLQAVMKLRERYSFTQEFAIDIHKEIPTEAGLGGGSSDAAAVLKAIVKMLHLPVQEQELLEIAKEIGADVPYFIKNEAAHVEGIGEKITPIKVKNAYSVLLIKPFLGCSTKEIFKQHVMQSNHSANIPLLINGLETGNFEEIAQGCGNDLTSAASSLLGDIERIIHKLHDFGLSCVNMSGSGSTIYAISEDRNVLEKAQDDFKQKGYYVKITSII